MDCPLETLFNNMTEYKLELTKSIYQTFTMKFYLQIALIEIYHLWHLLNYNRKQRFLTKLNVEICIIYTYTYKQIQNISKYIQTDEWNKWK